jgi:hypothetical protein
MAQRNSVQFSFGANRDQSVHGKPPSAICPKKQPPDSQIRDIWQRLRQTAEVGNVDLPLTTGIENPGYCLPIGSYFIHT